MRLSNYNNNIYSTKYTQNATIRNYNTNVNVYNKINVNLSAKNQCPNFCSNPLKTLKEFNNYIKAQRFSNWLIKYYKSEPNAKNLPFRNYSMENIEGLQFGIKVFKGLSMKDIQYLSENLHVIAVKRGCNNMCGYCYADAKPSNREMSWEDFTSITKGFKKIRKRLHYLPLFGENMTNSEETLIYRTTELFYDADCMNLAIKDKRGKVHDFRDLVNELYNSLGRKSTFDTSGWDPNNKRLQERAEMYAEYFSKPENMEKLNQFNISFNVFNASYIQGIKALKNNNPKRYMHLRERFTDRIANTIYTFTPLLKYENFNIMQRCFGLNAHNAKYFDYPSMLSLIDDVHKKLEMLYKYDLNEGQKYVKNKDDIKKYMDIITKKTESVDTGLNSVGRMKRFMEEFGIKAPMQDHRNSTKIMKEDLKKNGRYHMYIAHKLIDTDGRVYHMDYARFIPTEIQLNLKNKGKTPELANLVKDFTITKEIINRKETHRPISDFL